MYISSFVCKSPETNENAAVGCKRLHNTLFATLPIVLYNLFDLLNASLECTSFYYEKLHNDTHVY